MAKHYYVRVIAKPNEEQSDPKVHEMEHVNIDAARHSAMNHISSCGLDGDNFDLMCKYHKVEVVTKEITEVANEITWEYEEK